MTFRLQQPSYDKAFSPMIDAMSVVRKNNLQNDAGSWNKAFTACKGTDK